MDIYQEPDPNIEYKCSDNTISKGFTLLMKWVMLTKEHPELHDKIKEYIRDRPKEINKQNNDGWTALMMACGYSNGDSTENTVKMLIEAKANIDLHNNNGWTALMMACRNSKTESTENTVKMLIEADDNLTMNKIIENKIPSNIAELCLNKIYVKNYLKQRFTRSIVKHIPLIVSEFKLKYGTLSQKIITYNLELKNTNDKKSIYNIIHDKDNKIIDYLDIKNENDMSKLTEYVNLL